MKNLSHISAAYFENRTGADLQMVPYRGTDPALLDLLAGRIDVMFDQLSEAMARLRDGSIRAYAVTAAARSPVAPDVPNVDEAGLPGLYLNIWYGLWAPAGTPPAIVAKLNGAATADPAVQKRFADLGLAVPPPDQQTPEALGALQSPEIKKWWPIIKAEGDQGGVVVVSGLSWPSMSLFQLSRKTWMLGTRPGMTNDICSRCMRVVMAGLVPAIHVLL